MRGILRGSRVGVCGMEGVREDMGLKRDEEGRMSLRVEVIEEASGQGNRGWLWECFGLQIDYICSLLFTI